MASGGRNPRSPMPLPSRKVMVVVDLVTYPNREFATALQYALSHVVLENDTFVLLFVIGKKTQYHQKDQTSVSSGSGGEGEHQHPADYDDEEEDDIVFIEHVKNICDICKPRLEIVTEKIEIRDGEDKGPVILSETRRLGIDLLIIGQKRSISNAILGKRGGVGSFTGFDTAEFLIENCKCTCVAVQKKGKNSGYLLNTKTYRDFWLLA